MSGFEPLAWAEREAAAGYAALSERYKNRGHDGPFFFGHAASSLDAVVFGHLASARASAAASRWARAHALPALAPFFAAFAAAFFADDPLLGAAPFRSAVFAPVDAAAAAAALRASADAGAGASAAGAGAAAGEDDTANASLAMTPPACRGERGAASAFRARERRWLDALIALAAAEHQQAGAAAGARGAKDAPTPLPPPRHRLADFPLGFGEEPGAIDALLRGSGGGGSGSGWFFPDAFRAGREPNGVLINAAATAGIFAVAAAIILALARRRDRIV